MRLLFFYLLLCCTSLFGKEALFVTGYIGEEQATAAKKQLKEMSDPEIVVVVHSNGGTFYEVLSLCQTLQQKKEEGVSVVVLIEKRAIGPAALLPFVATHLYVTKDAVWGNIPYGTEGTIPRDIMVDAMRSIIPSGKEERQREQIAEAMVDPYSQVRGVPYTADPLLLSSHQITTLSLGQMIENESTFLRGLGISQADREKNEIAFDQVLNVVTPNMLTESMQAHIPYSYDKENYIGYVQLHGKLTEQKYTELLFATASFRALGTRLLVLDLNIPHGDIFAALKIADLLQRLDATYKIPSIAYVHEEALGAGALVAYGCRYIFADTQSSMGASDTVRHNALFASLAPEFARIASFWGRNSVLAEAMVTDSSTLVLRKHVIVPLQHEDQIVLNTADPDDVLTRPGDFLTVDGKTLYNIGIASSFLTGTSSMSEEDLQAGSWPADKSAVFSAPYLKAMPHATMVTSSGWTAWFFQILTHPVVVGLLFFGLLVGFYLELNTPGFGLLGSIGLLCFFLIVWGSVTVNTITWVQWLILAAGLVFFAVELFLIPGFGWTGITGILFILCALASFTIPAIGVLDLSQWNTAALVVSYMLPRLLCILGGLLMAGVVLYLTAKYLSQTVLNLSKLSLHGNIVFQGEEGDLHTHEEMPEIGALGEAFTALKPSGEVRIGDEIYQAVTQTGFIDKEVPVTVVRIERGKLVVRTLGDDD